MGSVKFTKAQSDAINVNSGSILVSAGAGSGKTAVLTQRVIEKLTNKENYIPADSLLISTFTKSASAEMKQRIEEKLEELISDNPTDEFLKSQQLLLSNAQISTIHSLCQNIIKENYHKLNLASGYRVADEKEIKILKDKVIDEILEENYTKGEIDFIELANMFSSKNDSAFKKMFDDVYKFIVSYPYPLEMLEELTSPYIDVKPVKETKWYNNIIYTLNRYRVSLEIKVNDLYNFVKDNEVEISQSAMENIQSELDDFYGFILKLKNDDIDLLQIKDNFPKNKIYRKKKNEIENKLFDKKKDIYTFLKEVDKVLDFNLNDYEIDMEYLSSKVKTIKRIVEEIYTAIQQEKKEISIIDYNDMEHFAVELLVEIKDGKYKKTDLAKSLSEQYNEIMVDECQDLNLAQNIIFWSLSKSSDEVSVDMDTDELLSDSKNLFMVGDVKQSIYRFRGAKPKLFVKRKDVYDEYNEENHTEDSLAKITLKDNFRSRKEVIDSVNAIFENIMSRIVGDIDYNEDEKLVSSGTFKDTNGDNKTEVHLIQNVYGDDNTQLEASYVANLIQKMVDEGFEIDDKGTVRKCTYKDFCILLRTAQGKVDIYSEKLKEIGIDSYVAKTQGYLERYEVVVMLDLLRVIDNPLIDTSLLSVMMSPIFAFTDTEIATIRIKNKKQPLYLNLLDEQKQGNIKVAKMLAKLEYLREQSITKQTDKLIQIIFDKTDFLLMMSVMPNGEQRKANLRLLVTLAQEYEAFGSYGLSGFIRYVDKATQTNHDFESANTISEKADVVKIVTIHNSKGLEYPICILADTNKEFNASDAKGDYILDETLGLGLKTIMSEHHKKYNNITSKSASLSISKDSISEEMRILYVAMTRAREKLIITSSFKKSSKKSIDEVLGMNLIPEICNKYIEWIMIAGKNSTQLLKELDLDIIGDDTNFPVTYKLIQDFTINQENGYEETEKFLVKPSEEEFKKISDKFTFEYKRKEVTKIPAKVTVTQIAKSKQEKQIFSLPKMKIEKEESLTGAQKGDILHKFMQYVDFEKAKENLVAELNRLQNEEYLTKKEIENINEKNVIKFLNSELMQRMLSSEKLHREYQFIYQIDAKEVNEEISEEFSKEKVLIQGIADLIIEETDGIVIVDYKTDYVNNEQDFIDRYAKQLEIYKEAMNQYFEKPVKECIIYSLHMGKEIKL